MIERIKKILKRNFYSLIYFYRYLGYRIFIVFIFGIVVAFLDGMGLTMFVPLLEIVGGGAENTPNLGKMKFVIDMVQSIGLDLNLGVVLMVLATFFVLKGIMKFLSLYYLVFIHQYFIKKLRVQLLDGLTELKYSYYVNSDVGRVQNTLTAETGRIANAFNAYFKAAQALMMVMVYLGFALVVNIEFSLLVLLGGVITNFLYRFLYKRTKIASSKLTRSMHNYAGELLQYISNYKYLKATSLIYKYRIRLKETIYRIEKTKRNIGYYQSIAESFREPLLIIVIVMVILIQVKILGSALGTIIISLLFFYRGLGKLNEVQMSWNSFLSFSGSMENIKDFFRSMVGNKRTNGLEKVDSFRSSVEFENVCFKYNKKYILENVNLVINKNETIAIVGASGSGKTTLVNLVSGILKTNKGRVKIDGININDLILEEYQSRLGYITQEAVIFNDTIYNNVTFWDDFNEENFKKYNYAIQKSQISEFVSNLDGKENAVLGNDGLNLSGGQKQRISIARELYKEIDILLFDEATSNLDSHSEKIIQKNIEDLKGRYTIIIIAHRLSTIRNADKVVLLNEGKIIDSGTFSDLYKSSEEFKNMVDMQTLHN